MFKVENKDTRTTPKGHTYLNKPAFINDAVVMLMFIRNGIS